MAKKGRPPKGKAPDPERVKIFAIRYARRDLTLAQIAKEWGLSMYRTRQLIAAHTKIHPPAHGKRKRKVELEEEKLVSPRQDKPVDQEELDVQAPESTEVQSTPPTSTPKKRKVFIFDKYKE